MNKHKTKFFKKTFEQNADEILKKGETLLIENTAVGKCLAKGTAVMTQETFVPLMGQMWDKAKTRYKKRYKQKALEFAEWAAKNYQRGQDVSGDVWFCNGMLFRKTTAELYEFWKEETKK